MKLYSDPNTINIQIVSLLYLIRNLMQVRSFTLHGCTNHEISADDYQAKSLLQDKNIFDHRK